ncbi:MAG: NACHT domain-containing protein [Methylobacter sp.]
MAKENRDEFTEKTKQQIAKRAGWLCSDPSCRRHTIGSNSDGDGEINLGIAAHICAAAPGGPRYDPQMTPEQRRSPANGIWMCQLHGKAVDAKDSTFTIKLLHEWKEKAQKESWRRVLYNEDVHGLAVQELSEDELSARLHAAAADDLMIFRRSEKWPSTSIALTLEVEGLNDSVSTSALATALTTLDDLVLVAPPGMGKTATVFQIAEAVLANGHSSPIVVPLGDWSADGVSLLESVLKRPAFRGITEDDLRTVAAKPGVILLLDGWNELDGAARKRAAIQVKRLQLELPEVSLLISTRKQALDVPVDGKRVDLLPLNEMQQLDIARTLRGDAGERIIDQAWRTAGVRELITIPLYLTVLLALPEESPFPTTKEEILRQFIAVHEQNNYRIEALAGVTHGFHQRFLEDLAVTALRSANTTLSETRARKSISVTDDVLVAEGQITEKPQPNAVLEVLVSYHLLMRSEDPAGYSFQHQQFQEWYASHMVELLMLASVDDTVSREALKADVLNLPVWEESILFACERLARGSQPQLDACSTAILAAFAVDPILAAEMIYRSTDAVWAHIGTTLQGLVGHWHKPGNVDRALGFMITSGRPEFLDQVWPLITHENDQIHLAALRAGRRFRPSLLGSDAAKRLTELPPKIRQNVLLEIAYNSGMDGLDLVAAVTKAEPDSEIKAAVINEFAFRRADRHIADVLKGADNKTFDLLAQNDLIDDVTDDAVKAGLTAARERRHKEGIRAYDQMHSLVYGRGDIDRSAELATVIAEMEIDNKQNGTVNLIYEAAKRFPRAIADGILRRVRKGHTLPYHASELMSKLGFEFEDNVLCDIALEGDRFDERANAAASVLGPKSVGRIIEKMFDAMKQIHDANGKYDKVAMDRYHTIQDRLRHTQAPCLLAAIAARSSLANNQEIAALADLISHYSYGENNHGQPFGSASLATIAEFVEDWGNRLLASADATRKQLVSITTLASHAPSAPLLPLLKRLLDEELRRWRAFKEQARVDHYRVGPIADEARCSWVLQYQRAFQAISGPETAALMREYLLHEDFGHSAALVLAGQWRNANEPNDIKLWKNGLDFSRVTERRAARTSDPTASSAEADAIFTALEQWIGEDATEPMRKHAVTLATVAVALPHGQRGDTINTLITIADRYQRCMLLNNLVLSGELIGVELIKQGIAEVFEAAQKQPWILTEPYELRNWLRLLPFSDRPTDAFDIVRALPEQHRTPDALGEMLNALGHAPGDDLESILFRLAEADPRLYASHAWRDAVIRRGILAAMTYFVNLAVQGVFNGKNGKDQWGISSLLAALIGEHPELRSHVYDLLRNGPTSPGLALLAKAVAENPDADGLLLLIQIEIEHKQAFVSWRTIKSVVTQHVTAENWEGAYNIVAVPAVELRRKLLAMTTDGGPADSAARYLNTIDEIRDDYGIPETEPRHPDLGSGKSWPILNNL